MKCPNCSHPDAYFGFTNIDCPNPSCKHFNNSKSMVATAAPVAPSPTTPNTHQHSGSQGIPGVPGLQPAQQPSQGQGNQATLLAQLGVSILAKQPKVNSVLLSFKAWGDPGYADKKVEFSFSLPLGGVAKHICTLSNSLRFYVDGVDADNQTTYTTHWLCTQDGVRPTDQFTLDASIYP